MKQNDNAEKISFSDRQAFSPIDFSWEVAARGNDRFWPSATLR
jgi:hypothetical protein